MTHFSFAGDAKTIGIDEGRAYRDALDKIIWGGEIPGIYSGEQKNSFKNLRHSIASHLAEEWDRIEALCRGAVLDYDDLLRVYEQELGAVHRLCPPVQGLIAVLPYGRFEEGVPTLAIAVDTPVFLFPFVVSRKYQQKKAYCHIEVSLMTIPGTLLGVNDQGLGAAFSLKPFEGDGAGSLPLSLVVREVLKKCRNTTGAVKLIESTARGASGTIVIADSVSIAVIELTPATLSVYEPKRDIFVSPGHFLLPDMMCRDFPHNTLYPQATPAELIGKRLYETSESRLERAYAHLNAQKKWDAHLLGKALLEPETGIPLFSGYYKTVLSALAIPARKMLFHTTLRQGAYTRSFL